MCDCACKCSGPCACLTTYVRATIGLCIVTVAVILDVVGFSVPFWAYQSDGTRKVFEGIWKNCTEEFDVTTCVDLVEVETPAWLKANQAVQTIGMLLLLASLFLLVIRVVCLTGNHTLKLIIIFFLGFAAAFILIGAVIYGSESTDAVRDNLNFAFIFVVVAAGLAIVASIFVCFKP